MSAISFVVGSINGSMAAATECPSSLHMLKVAQASNYFASDVYIYIYIYIYVYSRNNIDNNPHVHKMIKEIIIKEEGVLSSSNN